MRRWNGEVTGTRTTYIDVVKRIVIVEKGKEAA
jgi:hypothetical protein